MPRYSWAIPKPRTASPFQSDSSGKVRSSTCVQAACDQGLSREIPNTRTPAPSNSLFLSRRVVSSSCQVPVQS